MKAALQRSWSLQFFLSDSLKQPGCAVVNRLGLFLQ